MTDDPKEDVNPFPEDENLREMLCKKAKWVNYLGWIVSGFAVIFLIITWKHFLTYYIIYMMGFLFTGQAIRYYARELVDRAYNPRSALSQRQLKKYKEEQEKVVRTYCEQNKDVSEKILQMNDLANKGKYQDAYNIAASLIRRDPPRPVKVFLINKQKLYEKHIKGFSN